MPVYIAPTLTIHAPTPPFHLLLSLPGYLKAAGHQKVFKIGGADVAAELDAKRAIDQVLLLLLLLLLVDLCVQSLAALAYLHAPD